VLRIALEQLQQSIFIKTTLLGQMGLSKTQRRERTKVNECAVWPEVGSIRRVRGRKITDGACLRACVHGEMG
jgi:hypothetical protein